MKSAFVAVALFAGAVVAQTDPAAALGNLPACGKVCITNMLGKAAEFGCKGATDVACLCGSQNFKYGVRDCIDQACPAADKGTVTDFGNSICAAAQAPSGAASTVTDTAVSGTATVVVSTGTDSAGNTITSTLGPVSGGVGGGVISITTTDSAGSTFVTVTAVSGVASLTTYTDSAGATITSAISAIGGAFTTFTDSAGATITSAISAAESGASSAASDASSKVSSAEESGKSALSSASESITGALGSLSSAVSSATARASSSTSAGGAPRVTGFAGMVGAGGLMALALL